VIGDTGRDLRYAVRTLRRTPGFTAIAVLTLALGIGATSAVFSIAHAVLIRPLPYRQPERLVAIWERITREQGMSKLFAQYRDLEHWQAHSQSFEQLAGVTWATGERILTGHGAPRTVLAIPATVDLFAMLGVPPMLGRTFERADLTRGCTLVLAHRFWQEVLGAPQDLSSLRLGLDDQACTSAGVMPAGFAFFPEATSVWRLVTPNDPLVRNPERTGGLGVFGRLKPGVTLDGAQAELIGLSRQLDRGVRYGTEMEPRVYPLQDEFTFLARRNLRVSVFVLIGAVSFVLLIACVNVANLLIGRSAGRQRELAIRGALGSGRGRLVRQLLVESLVLSAAAAGLGTLFATGAVRAFQLANPVELPVGVSVDVSRAMLAFTGLLAIATTMVFGVVPAWRASQIDLQLALRTAGRGSGVDRARHVVAKTLTVAEVALSLLLLVGAGLLIESVMRFASAPLGFDAEGLLTAGLTLPPMSYTTSADRAAFFDRVSVELSRDNAIRQFAMSTVPPLQSGRGSRVLVVEGRPEPTPSTAVHDIGEQSVSSEYFRVMGIAQRLGRAFARSDSADATPVAIVNEALVRRYLPDGNPIGRQIRYAGEPEPANPWTTIVGVVADEKRPTPYYEMAWADAPVVYRPLSQKAPQNEVTLLLRTNTGPGRSGVAIQPRVARLDPAVVVGSTQPAQGAIARFVAYPRFRAWLLGAFAAVALLLATVGLYGVLSQLVAQRTQEIGVRMALGATRANVLTSVVGEGMLLAAIGVTIGLVAAFWASRFLASLLFGVAARDPLTWSAVSAVLLAAAFVATYLPARRAATVDPMVALRHE
jgi:putative ABC transport system permease protein